MKKILLPTDFSEASKHAIQYALNLYQDEAHYVLMHAYHTPQAGATMMYSINPLLEKEAMKELRALADDLRQNTTFTPSLEIEAVQGHTVDSCRWLLRKQDFDLVVMGTHGASSVFQKLFGSNTANAIHNLEAPVLAVPVDAPIKAPQKVAFAADHKPVGEDRVLLPLSDILARTHAALTLVHVEPVLAEGGDTIPDVPQAIQAIPHDIRIVHEERVADGLEEFIENDRPDLLALIEHQYTFWEGILHRSITKQMALHASVPLLVMHDRKLD